MYVRNDYRIPSADVYTTCIAIAAVLPCNSPLPRASPREMGNATPRQLAEEDFVTVYRCNFVVTFRAWELGMGNEVSNNDAGCRSSEIMESRRPGMINFP